MLTERGRNGQRTNIAEPTPAGTVRCSERVGHAVGSGCSYEQGKPAASCSRHAKILYTRASIVMRATHRYDGPDRHSIEGFMPRAFPSQLAVSIVPLLFFTVTAAAQTNGNGGSAST